METGTGDTASEDRTVEWVYGGFHLERDGTPHHLWYASWTEDRIDLKDPSLFSQARGAPRSAVVGGIYSINGGSTGWFLKNAEYLRSHGSEEQVNQMRLHSKARKAEQSRNALIKKLASDNTELGDMTLKDIRKAYFSSSNSQSRSGLLAAIIQYLD